MQPRSVHNAKLGGSPGLLESRKALQKGTGQAGSLVKASGVRYKAKSLVLHLGHSNPEKPGRKGA